jgi:HSP20 family protein
MNMAIETQEKGALKHYEPAVLSSPFSLMRRLSDDMEQIFEDTFGARRFPRLLHRLEATERRWIPDVEAFERKGEFVIRTDVPGLTKDDVKVEISDGELVIQGERKQEKEQKEKDYYACERSYGAFYRSIPLPEGVKADDAKATFKDGVLEITMPAPKVPEKHGRRLEIKSA